MKIVAAFFFAFVLSICPLRTWATTEDGMFPLEFATGFWESVEGGLILDFEFTSSSMDYPKIQLIRTSTRVLIAEGRILQVRRDRTLVVEFRHFNGERWPALIFNSRPGLLDLYLGTGQELIHWDLRKKDSQFRIK